MNSGRRLTLGAGILFFATAAFSTPPYFWYSTYSINDYGCYGGEYCLYQYWSSLTNCVADANGFYYAVAAHSAYLNNPSYQYDRRNADVTADRWSGPYAEINYNDFGFFAGHGSGFGPVFTGCTMVDPRYTFSLGSGAYLKWLQAASCEWFCHPDYACGVSEFTRWSSSFNGVHAVMAHRALTYDDQYSYEMSGEFLDRWVVNGESLFNSWKWAQIDWVYYNNGPIPGLQPAEMAHNSAYLSETWANAGDEQAPPASKQMALSWGTVGYPQY
jgi:hypothetical protein